MKTLRIRVPYAWARQYVEEALQFRSGCRLPKTLRLRATVGDAPLPYADEPWKIRWDPEPGSISAPFQGELSVRAGATSAGVILNLEGNYIPPFGSGGVLYDSAIEPKIAAAAAHSLLSEIAVELEAQYDRDEAEDGVAP